MNKKILHIFAIIILAILFTGTGMFIGNSSGSSIDETLCVSLDETQKQIMADLKQKFDLKVEGNLIPFVLLDGGEEMFLSGKIDSLQQDTINIKVKNIFKSDDFFSYLNEPDFYIKTIKISAETEIIKQEMKDQEDFDDEIEEYNKDQTGLPPLPYEEIPITIKDLQKGVEISVETDVAINLKENEVINAQKIIITINGDDDNNDQDY